MCMHRRLRSAAPARGCAHELFWTKVHRRCVFNMHQARNGDFNSKEQFLAHYGILGETMWSEAYSVRQSRRRHHQAKRNAEGGAAEAAAVLPEPAAETTTMLLEPAAETPAVLPEPAAETAAVLPWQYGNTKSRNMCVAWTERRWGWHNCDVVHDFPELLPDDSVKKPETWPRAPAHQQHIDTQAAQASQTTASTWLGRPPLAAPSPDALTDSAHPVSCRPCWHTAKGRQCQREETCPYCHEDHDAGQVRQARATRRRLASESRAASPEQSRSSREKTLLTGSCRVR